MAASPARSRASVAAKVKGEGLGKGLLFVIGVAEWRMNAGGGGAVNNIIQYNSCCDAA
jgi:hypothetical protein